MEIQLPFNINNKVTFKLTDYGLELLQEVYKKQYVGHFKSFEDNYKDTKGNWKMQLWVIMSLFGDKLSNGGVQIFANSTINIPIKIS